MFLCNMRQRFSRLCQSITNNLETAISFGSLDGEDQRERPSGSSYTPRIIAQIRKKSLPNQSGIDDHSMKLPLLIFNDHIRERVDEKA